MAQTEPPVQAVPEPASARGAVMVIGGAEDKLRDKVILHRFVKMAAAENGRIVVISTASSLGDEATNLYRELFTQMGAGSVTGLRPVTREEANGEEGAAAVTAAGCRGPVPQPDRAGARRGYCRHRLRRRDHGDRRARRCHDRGRLTGPYRCLPDEGPPPDDGLGRDTSLPPLRLPVRPGGSQA